MKSRIFLHSLTAVLFLSFFDIIHGNSYWGKSQSGEVSVQNFLMDINKGALKEIISKNTHF
jgi:hypothetical protein